MLGYVLLRWVEVVGGEERGLEGNKEQGGGWGGWGGGERVKRGFDRIFC